MRDSDPGEENVGSEQKGSSNPILWLLEEGRESPGASRGATLVGRGERTVEYVITTKRQNAAGRLFQHSLLTK